MVEIIAQIEVFSKKYGYSEQIGYWLFIISQAEFIALQQEKEAALQQCKKLEEEIQTLRIYYR